MTAVGAGTLLREQMRHFPAGRSGIPIQVDNEPERARQIIEERSATLRADLERTLQAMRVMIEREAPPAR